MQSKIRRKTVDLRSEAPRVSRIRRDPVRMPTEAELKMAEVKKREREKWRAFTGVIVFAAAIAALTVGISAATYSRYDPAEAAREAKFRQCYNGGANCVLDGDTIYVERQKMEIAGLDAPEISGAACGDERERGIDAAVKLEDLLNGGQVTVSQPFRDAYGRTVRNVEVGGKDVTKAMIKARAGRAYDGVTHNYCG